MFHALRYRAHGGRDRPEAAMFVSGTIGPFNGRAVRDVNLESSSRALRGTKVNFYGQSVARNEQLPS